MAPPSTPKRKLPHRAAKDIGGEYPQVTGPKSPSSSVHKRRLFTRVSCSSVGSRANNPLSLLAHPDLPQLGHEDAKKWWDWASEDESDLGPLLQPFYEHPELMPAVKPDWKDDSKGRVPINGHPYYGPALMAHCSLRTFTLGDDCKTCNDGRGVFKVSST